MKDNEKKDPGLPVPVFRSLPTLSLQQARKDIFHLGERSKAMASPILVINPRGSHFIVTRWSNH
jgi:hypothetical protein